MAKSSNVKSNRVIKKDAFAKTDDKKYNRVGLRSVFSARIRLPGPVTGELYEWSDAGAIVSVDSSDVTQLLRKRVGVKGCCGGNRNGNKLFELVD